MIRTKTYTNLTQPKLTGVSGGEFSMPLPGGSHPDPRKVETGESRISGVRCWTYGSKWKVLWCTRKWIFLVLFGLPISINSVKSLGLSCYLFYSILFLQDLWQWKLIFCQENFELIRCLSRALIYSLINALKVFYADVAVHPYQIQLEWKRFRKVLSELDDYFLSAMMIT